MVTLSVTVDAATAHNTVIDNTATINSSGTTPVSASDAFTVIDPLAVMPVLHITLTPDNHVIRVGEEVIYSVDYANISRGEALDIQIIAYLPANVIFVNAADGGIYETSASTHWIRWDLGTLSGEAAGQTTYRVQHLDKSSKSTTAQSAATVDVIDALVSISASNTLPITNDKDEAKVLVLAPLVPPALPIQVDTMSPWALLMLVLMLMIPGYRRIKSKPGSSAIRGF